MEPDVREECLPLTERSFCVLIQRYKEEAAAARAVAMRKGVNSSIDISNSCDDMLMAAHYIEDLVKDAERLYSKLQAHNKHNSTSNDKGCGQIRAVTPWTEGDVNTLRLLGFDVRQLMLSRRVEEGCANTNAATPSQQLNAVNLNALLSLEKKMHALQLNADRLADENAVLRSAFSREKKTVVLARQPEKKNTFETTRVPAHDPLALKNAHIITNSCVQEAREKCGVTSHSGCASDGVLNGAAAERSTGYPYSVIENAFITLRSVEASQRVRYHMANNCGDVGLVDVAVIRLLNDLDFPFTVHIRRLGPGGRYFIDQDVEIKLAEGQLLVRPWPLTSLRAESLEGGKSARYEHLAKYLIHLYSPAIDLDKAVGLDEKDVGVRQSKHKSEDGDDIKLDDQISSLKRHQLELEQALEVRREQLRQYQGRLEACSLPSSEAHYSNKDAPVKKVGVSLQPRRQSPRDTVPAATQGGPCTSGTTADDKIAHILSLVETNGRVPDLSRLSESELRRLRRRLHIFQGVNSILSPSSTD